MNKFQFKSILFLRNNYIYQYCLVYLIVFLSFSCGKNDDFRQNEIEDNIIHINLFSDFVQEDYPIIIYLPPAYDSSSTYPVIYLTDGSQLFGRLLENNKKIELDAIIVAIGDLGNDRGRDFVSNDCGGDGSSGHHNFYEFIRSELIPYIDANYQNDHKLRTLVGHSLGGLFSTMALFMEDPNDVLFYRFVSIDPAFKCGEEELNEFLKKMKLERYESFKLLHSQSKHLESKWFNDYLKAKNFNWVNTQFIFYENEDHQSVVSPSLYDGLKFVYEMN